METTDVLDNLENEDINLLLEKSQEGQEVDKDVIIADLKKQLETQNKTFLVEKELIKNNAKNITATKALLDIDIDFDDDTFLDNIKMQIENLKNSEENSFLFAEKKEAFKGMKVVKNEELVKANKSLKDCVKNYFNV